MSTPYCRSKIWCSEYKKEQKYCLLFLDSYSIFFFFGNTRTIRITVSMHMIIMYVILHIPLIGHLACFTFITKKMSKNETRHLNSDSMGHYGMCHWALSQWWWGCLDWSYSTGSLFLGGSKAVIGRFTCACGIISGMSGPTMSCWIWWGYNVYPWGHAWRFPSLGFDTWHSPMPRGSAFELRPWENEPYMVEDKSLDMYHGHFITILIILFKWYLFFLVKRNACNFIKRNHHYSESIKTWNWNLKGSKGADASKIWAWFWLPSCNHPTFSKEVGIPCHNYIILIN